MRWENVTFIDFDDFYQNRKLLRDCYKELSLKDKILLKRFIYDDLKECTTDKDVIWNFLNENEDCKKDLAVRVKTRLYSKKRHINNLFETVELINKQNKIKQKRLDLLGLLKDN